MEEIDMTKLAKKSNSNLKTVERFSCGCTCTCLFAGRNSTKTANKKATVHNAWLKASWKISNIKCHC